LIDTWLQLPLPLRYVWIAFCGVLLGAVVNWAIYTLAFFPRPISPWGPRAGRPAGRSWKDHLPIVGWWWLRRESELHGRGFWIRPLLIECSFGLALCGFYHAMVIEWGFVDPSLAAFPRRLGEVSQQLDQWLNVIFSVHTLLAALMLAATFIDFDEMMIPDWILVPGTLLALMIASWTHQMWMPVVTDNLSGVQRIEPVFFHVPGGYNPWWDGWRGLAVACGLYSGWCFALADRRLIFRRGLKKAVRYFFGAMVRRGAWKILLSLWLVGLVGIVAVYALGDLPWRSLLTSLVGMALGGGAVWGVRLVAGAAVKREAMGFGDVLLMAMIGAFVGWQAALLAFAIAPITAIAIVFVQFLITRNRVVAFGPYLCAGTVVTILLWPTVWLRFGEPMSFLGPWLYWIYLGMLGLMGVMLMVWRWLKEAILGRG